MDEVLESSQFIILDLSRFFQVFWLVLDSISALGLAYHSLWTWSSPVDLIQFPIQMQNY